MIKKIISLLCIGIFAIALCGCAKGNRSIKIGASFGVGEAPRWEKEKALMEEKAKELGAELEVRINKDEESKSQEEDCKELVDTGIDVLIFIPRNGEEVGDIVSYAQGKGVKVIAYARNVMNEKVDLYIGYDCYKMGRDMGEYLVEKADKGDYILLKGDEKDTNTMPLYEGAMENIEPLKDSGDINIIGDEFIPKWSTEEAEKIVKKLLAKNNNQVDAILAPNDKIAGVCREVLDELKITKKVAITGMDADINALKRILEGTQDMTLYMDLKELADSAVEQACKLAVGEKPESNATFFNNDNAASDAYLVNGKAVTKENMERVLIEPGYFERSEIYGE